MELLIFFLIGYIGGWILIKGGGAFLNYVEDKRAIKAAMKPEISPYDEDGHRKEYDPHYTRAMEIEYGVKVTTQCEDTTCTKCYWKARMLDDWSAKDFPPGSDLLTKRQEWIKSQLDGLSDELYDSMYDDWLAEMKPEIEKSHKQLEERREAKRRRKEEEYYCTPYDDIKKYQAEGRTYKPGAGWSHPKDVKPKRAMVIDNDMSITQWLAEVERLKKEMKALAHTPGNLDLNPIVDLQVEYEWDLKSGQYYRTLISVHKNGGKSFKKETVSKKEYNDWRH